jgi:hypothetical protein
VKRLSLRQLEHANALAKEIEAKAVVIYADALEGESDVREVARRHQTFDYPIYPGT